MYILNKNIHYSTKLFWAFNLLVFLLPTYLLRFKIAGFSTNLFEACFLFILIWWFCETILKRRKLNFNLICNQNHFLHIGMGALLIGAILSTIFSYNQLVSLGILKSWFVVPILFFLILVSIVQDHKDKTISILKALAFSGIIVSIIAILYLILGTLTYDDRLKAFYEHPNQLAMYLAPTWIIVSGFLLASKKKKEKKLWILSLMTISIPLFFTYSYGSWVGILAGTIILLLRHRKNKKEGRLIYRYVIISLILVILLIQLFLPKFQDIFLTQRSSLHSRFMIWRSSTHILKDNWALGIGPGTFQQTYLDYQKYFPPYLEWAVPQPHNIFLAFWLQTGLIGFIGFLIILIWFFKQGLRRICEDKKEAFLASILLALMVYTLIHGLVDTTYWKNDLAIIFWILIGLMSTISRQTYLQRKGSLRDQKQ